MILTFLSVRSKSMLDKEKVKSKYMLLGHNEVNIVAKNKDKTI